MVDRLEEEYRAHGLSSCLHTNENDGAGAARTAVQFPDIVANADNMISMIDQLKDHPGKAASTGPVLGRAPAIGGPQADLIARHEQVLAEGMGQFIASVRGSNLRITRAKSCRARSQSTEPIDS